MICPFCSSPNLKYMSTIQVMVDKNFGVDEYKLARILCTDCKKLFLFETN